METDRSQAVSGKEHQALHAIPGFTIEGLLGQGGMGLVYRGTQHRPRRSVALKLLRPSAISQRALRRFEREVEILARLQHPSIARVYEAGVIESGPTGQPTPYFAMELIDGMGLRQFAEAKGLSTEEQIELFVSVCDAVHYAHEQGVVHRDLKPANILVDQAGRAKVLDFGIARVTDSDLTLTTLQTDVGQLLGTLAYMSPEQVVGDPSSVDARSDVYALGVTLYELLCGHLPYSVETGSLLEAARVIREEEPEGLSSHDRALRGDIETIVGRCLEKEPPRRYASAEALAQDLRRYLASQPIEARPPSGWYRATRFTKRNKTLVAGLAAVFITLLLGMMGTSLALSQAVEAQRREAQERGEADRQRVEAQAAARRAEASERAMARALEDEKRMRQLAQDRSLQSDSIGVIYRTIISEFDSDIASEQDKTQLLSMLAAGERLIEQTGDLHPEAIAELRLSIGRGYNSLARPKEALDHFIEADRLYSASAGPASNQAVLARRNLAMTQDESVPVSVIVDELEQLSAVARRVGGYESQLQGVIISDLGLSYYASRDLQKMLTFFETHYPAVSIPRLLSQDEIGRIESVWSWGLLEAGRFAEAAPVLVSLYKRQQETLGAEHSKTLDTAYNLAHAYLGTNQPDQTVGLLEQALPRAERLYHRNPQRNRPMRRMLGRGYYLTGQTGKAISMYQALYDDSRSRYDRYHPESLIDEYHLALALMQDHQYDAARKRFAFLLPENEKNLGPDHPHSIATLSALARCNLALEDHTTAKAQYREAVERYSSLFGPDQPVTLNTRRMLVVSTSRSGQHDQALGLAEDLLEDAVRVLGQSDATTAKIAVTMGRCEMDAGRPAMAQATILEWLDRLPDQQWPEAFFLYRTYEYLSRTCESLDDPEGAGHWAGQAEQLQARWGFPVQAPGRAADRPSGEGALPSPNDHPGTPGP